MSLPDRLSSSDRRYTSSGIGNNITVIKELDFSPCLIDSRQRACESLATVYRNVKNLAPADTLQEQSPSRSNMILISLVSGTGKSTLFQQFVDEVNMNANLGKDIKPYFLKGKRYEKSGAPYSAIITAFGDFANELMPSNQNGQVSEEAKIEV